MKNIQKISTFSKSSKFPPKNNALFQEMDYYRLPYCNGSASTRVSWKSFLQSSENNGGVPCSKAFASWALGSGRLSDTIVYYKNLVRQCLSAKCADVSLNLRDTFWLIFEVSLTYTLSPIIWQLFMIDGEFAACGTVIPDFYRGNWQQYIGMCGIFSLKNSLEQIKLWENEKRQHSPIPTTKRLRQHRSGFDPRVPTVMQRCVLPVGPGRGWDVTEAHLEGSQDSRAVFLDLPSIWFTPQCYAGEPVRGAPVFFWTLTPSGDFLGARARHKIFTFFVFWSF